MTRPRVVVTGIGIVSPLGIGRSANLESVRSGRSGIRNITLFDASAFTCRIAGEIDSDKLPKEGSDLDRFAWLAVTAADEAVRDASLASSGIAPEKIATIVGTGMGGTETLDRSYERLYAQKQTRMPPMTIPRSMYNAAASAISTRFRALGPSFTTVSACASAAHAIGQAAELIRNGACEAAITGGTDSPLTPGSVRAWEGLRVLATDNDSPAQACRPFDRNRRGIVLAEGSAMFVLETLESAERRGAQIYGEIAGFGMSSDGGHITDPSADGAVRAIEMALATSRLSVDDIDYINAHGTATRANDVTESAAIRRVFGARAKDIPVSSTKSMHGHAMGASPAFELALSLLALGAGFLPPTINYVTPDPECDLDCVPNAAREAAARTFLSNSFGFGGVNAVLAVKTRRGM